MKYKINKSIPKVVALSEKQVQVKECHGKMAVDVSLPPITTYSYVYSKRALQRKQKTVLQTIKNAENIMLQELIFT